MNLREPPSLREDVIDCIQALDAIQPWSTSPQRVEELLTHVGNRLRGMLNKVPPLKSVIAPPNTAAKQRRVRAAL